MQNRNRLRDIENKQTSGNQREEGRREGQIRGTELRHTNYYV